MNEAQLDLAGETLEGCEQLIKTRIKMALEIGEILEHIKSTQLYLESHTNWDEYTQAVFGFTGRWANRLLEAPKEPKKAPPAPVLSGAISGNKSSDLLPKPPAHPEEIIVHFDREKRQVPQDLVPFWQEADEQCADLDRFISSLSAAMKELQEDEDPVWNNVDLKHWKMHLRNLRTQIKFARPWAYCPRCDGDGGVAKNCTTCHGAGWLSFREWGIVPEDQR